MADDIHPVCVQTSRSDDITTKADGISNDNYNGEKDRLIRPVKADDQSSRCSQQARCIRGLSTNTKSIILSVFTLVGHLLMSIILPIKSSTFKQIGSDVCVGQIVDSVWQLSVMYPMFLICRCFDKSIPLLPTASVKALFLYGMSGAIAGTFIVFASLPDRTPPYLQAILGSTLIPFTVICRYIMLRKGVSLRRGVCIVCAMIGLFITMEPRIWNLTGSSGTGSTTNVSAAARILWPLSFCFGFVPDAVNRVVTEQELKIPQTSTMNFLAYAQLSAVISIIVIFWADLIPGFGMADSLGTFWQQLSTGMRCSVEWDTSCHNLSLKVWLMISAHVIGYVFHFLLIKHAEGAILASLVQAMRTPIASIFWTLYHYNEEGDYLYWSPEFNITTCFLIGGLLIVLPAMLMYNYFSNEEIDRVHKREHVLIVQEPGTVGTING